MKKEYDFSRAEQGKFFRSAGRLEVPVYLDGEVEKYFSKAASRKKVGLDKMVNAILRKEMDLLKSMGV